MPSPTVYAQSDFNPLAEQIDNTLQAQSKLFYVTDRKQAGPNDKQPNYTNQRGQLSRAGSATCELSPPREKWHQLVEVTMQG